MCNAAHVAEHTFTYLPSLERIKTCTTCNDSNNRKFTCISINVDILLNKGLQYIQEAINDAIISKQTCIKCNNTCEIIENYGLQILIDTSIVTDVNYLKNIKLQPKTYNLDDIQKNITIGTKKYIIRGVVNYINYMRHYTAVLFTNTTWYEYDDLKSKRIQVSPTKYKLTPHVLLYGQIN